MMIRPGLWPPPSGEEEETTPLPFCVLWVKILTQEILNFLFIFDFLIILNRKRPKLINSEVIYKKIYSSFSSSFGAFGII